MEDYEMIPVIKIRRNVERSLETESVNFFALQKKDCAYFKLTLRENSMDLLQYSVDETEKFSPEEFPILNPKEASVSVVSSIKKKLTGDENYLVVIMEDLRTNKYDLENTMRKLIHKELSRPITNKLLEEIEVTTPMDTLDNEYKYTTTNEFTEESIILKYHINKYYNDDEIDIYYYKIFLMDSTFIKELIQEIKYYYTVSHIKNYIKYSIKNQYSQQSSSPYPKSFSYSTELNAFEGSKCDKKDPRKKWSSRFNKYKEVYEDLTPYAAKGIKVLLYHACRNEYFFRKILQNNLDQGSLDFLCEFLCSKEEKSFNEKLEDLIKHLIENREYVEEAGDAISISNFRFFLVLFYVECCHLLNCNLVDEIKRMAEDFDERRIFDCYIDDAKAIRIIYKAIDYISLLPVDDYIYFDKNVQAFALKYDMDLSGDLEEFNRQAKMFSLCTIMTKIRKLPSDFIS